jgi:arylformamidase
VLEEIDKDEVWPTLFGATCRLSLSRMSRFIDLSHSIVPGLKTYPGLPSPVIGAYMSRQESKSRYATGTTFHIGKIEMVSNTATYIDAPFHRYADGMDMTQLPLESTADLAGVVLRVDGGVREVGTGMFNGVDVKDKAVLVHTGWATRWGADEYFEGHPFLTAKAAEMLVAAGAKLVGIDSLNIDSTDNGTRPVHSTLLAAGIPIVEHLCNLERLPNAGFRFFAAPVKVQGMGSFPVRAFAIVGSEKD